MKNITITIMTVLVLMLTACGGASGNQQTTTDPTSNASSAELPLASKLAIGSFKLDETEFAITPEQAGELLPLWQVFQQLSTSDTAAQEEITALAEQIQETMTAEQIQAINEMNLTPQDLFTTLQEQGVTGAGGQTFTQRGPDNSEGGTVPVPPDDGDQVFVGPGGGGGPGNGSGGGPEFGGGQGLSPEQIATAQARRAENGGGGFQMLGTPVPLINALIELLQEKAGS